MQMIFVHPDGQARTVPARAGDSVMETALAQGIAGIVAECGGSMMCATCHCYVDPAWTAATGPRADGEDEMLDGVVAERRETSRLSCQIRLTPALDGLVVHLPAAQS